MAMKAIFDPLVVDRLSSHVRERACLSPALRISFQRKWACPRLVARDPMSCLALYPVTSSLIKLKYVGYNKILACIRVDRSRRVAEQWKGEVKLSWLSLRGGSSCKWDLWWLAEFEYGFWEIILFNLRRQWKYHYLGHLFIFLKH